MSDSNAAMKDEENILDDLLHINHQLENEDFVDEHAKKEEEEDEDAEGLLKDEPEDNCSNISDDNADGNVSKSSHSDSENSIEINTKIEPEIKDEPGGGLDDVSDEESKHGDKKEIDSESEEKKAKAENSDDSDSDSPKKLKLASRVTRPFSESSAETPVKKKGPKKSYDYATKLNYLFRDARFFLVKSSVEENVTISKRRGVWSTPPANEVRFNKAFKEARNVLLIYSVKESGRFCGFARLATESSRDGPSVNWVLPPGLSARALGGVFKIDWICHRVI